MGTGDNFIGARVPVYTRYDEVVLLPKNMKPLPFRSITLKYMELMIVWAHGNHRAVAIPGMTADTFSGQE